LAHDGRTDGHRHLAWRTDSHHGFRPQANLSSVRRFNEGGQTSS